MDSSTVRPKCEGEGCSVDEGCSIIYIGKGDGRKSFFRLALNPSTTQRTSGLGLG
jgi:hypothetical protein